jgi:hypothetical protein
MTVKPDCGSCIGLVICDVYNEMGGKSCLKFLEAFSKYEKAKKKLDYVMNPENDLSWVKP